MSLADRLKKKYKNKSASSSKNDLASRLKSKYSKPKSTGVSPRDMGGTDIDSLAFIFQTMTNELGDDLIRLFSPETANKIEAISDEYRKENPSKSFIASMITPDLVDVATLGASKIPKVAKALSGMGTFSKMATRGATGSLLDQIGRGKVENFEAEDIIDVPLKAAGAGLASGVLGKTIGGIVDSSSFRKLQSGLANTQTFKALIKKNDGSETKAIEQLEEFINKTGARGNDVQGYDVAKGHFVDSEGNFPEIYPELQEVSAKELNRRFNLAKDVVGKEIGGIVKKVSKSPESAYKKGEVGLVDKQNIVDQVDADGFPVKVTDTDQLKNYEKIKDKSIDFLFAPDRQEQLNIVKGIAGAKANLKDIEMELKGTYGQAGQEAKAMKARFDSQVKEYRKDINSKIANRKLQLKDVKKFGDISNRETKIRNELKELKNELNSPMDMETLQPDLYKIYTKNKTLAEKMNPMANPRYVDQKAALDRLEMSKVDLEDVGQIPLSRIHDSTKDIGYNIDWGAKRGKDADPIKEQALKNVRASMNNLLRERIEPTNPRFTPLREEYGRLTDLSGATSKNIDMDTLIDIEPRRTRGGFALNPQGGKLYSTLPFGEKLEELSTGARSFVSGAIDKPSLAYPSVREGAKMGISKGVEEAESRINRSPDSIINQIENIPQVLIDKKFKRNSTDTFSQRKSLAASLAMEQGNRFDTNFLEMYGSPAHDLVLNSNEEDFNRMFPNIVEGFPHKFEFDSLNRINNKVPLPMRSMAQKDIMLDDNLSNKEKIAKISEMNRTGKLV